LNFSIRNRPEMVSKLKSERFDCLVIGGGITGAGIALDATTRGMKTALVEMQDFAAGTSSRSTKLVHGGLRYLKQFEVGLVAEVGKERNIVYENGPHVTTPLWMTLPFYRGGALGKLSTSIGLRLYDFLAGVKKSERRTMLSAAETLEKEPLLKNKDLLGSGYYVEYRTDDARLTIEVIKSAFENGAMACNYIKVVHLIYENGKVAGVTVQDQLNGEKYDIRAKRVVNAAGPWVDHIREMDQSKKGKTLQLTKGVHLVIDQSRFPLKQAIYFEAQDGRMIFAILREKKVYAGTTDTFYDLDPEHPFVTSGDCEYILAAINDMFPALKLSVDDIESSWAGVRPLIFEEGKKASEISRKDEIWESSSGLITIAGGKLTGYRKMAETVVDILAAKLRLETGKQYSPCQTKMFPISGGNVGGSEAFRHYVAKNKHRGVEIGLTEIESEQLARMYGSNVELVFQLLKEYKGDAWKYGIPLSLFAKLVYGIEHEMVVSPIDFFLRRTGAILFNIHCVQKFQDQVISFMAEKMDWTNEEKKDYRLILASEMNAARKARDNL
jgi:glycerol-3-phosphate dehydrogenase